MRLVDQHVIPMNQEFVAGLTLSNNPKTMLDWAHCTIRMHEIVQESTSQIC